MCKCSSNTFEIPNKKPHKHADLIKAWADGAVIQCQEPDGTWFNCEFAPRWRENINYRIKPEPKPDVVKYSFVNCFGKKAFILTSNQCECDNVKFIFDGENPDKLKSVEIIHGKEV